MSRQRFRIITYVQDLWNSRPNFGERGTFRGVAVGEPAIWAGSESLSLLRRIVVARVFERESLRVGRKRAGNRRVTRGTSIKVKRSAHDQAYSYARAIAIAIRHHIDRPEIPSGAVSRGDKVRALMGAPAVVALSRSYRARESISEIKSVEVRKLRRVNAPAHTRLPARNSQYRVSHTAIQRHRNGIRDRAQNASTKFLSYV